MGDTSNSQLIQSSQEKVFELRSGDSRIFFIYVEDSLVILDIELYKNKQNLTVAFFNNLDKKAKGVGENELVSIENEVTI